VAERAAVPPPVAIFPTLCHKAAFPPPGLDGLPWRRRSAQSARSWEQDPDRRGHSPRRRPEQESQMPKMKTKSGAKKRFKLTGTGKVLSAMSGKRHGMIKRTNKQIRQLRGTRVTFKTDGDNIKKYWLPNA
jgi:large subunit ribosomal protein L35